MLRLPDPALDHERAVADLRRLVARADGSVRLERLKLAASGGRAEALAARLAAGGPLTVIDLTRRVGDATALLFLMDQSALDGDDILE